MIYPFIQKISFGGEERANKRGTVGAFWTLEHAGRRCSSLLKDGGDQVTVSRRWRLLCGWRERRCVVVIVMVVVVIMGVWKVRFDVVVVSGIVASVVVTM